MPQVKSGRFIEPDATLRNRPFEELHDLFDIKILSGHRAELRQLNFHDEDFRDTVSRIAVTHGFEDQCSAKYYYDMHNLVMAAAGEVGRVIEVGIFMGGASVLLAGCAEKIGAELVMIDIEERFLLFAYERLIRSFPAMADRVRLYHGDLPTYVRDVLVPEQSAEKFIVQLDGSHHFEEVMRDMGTLSYVQHRLHSVIAQDTHLRGPPIGGRFVDCALQAVFGGEFQFMPIGSEFQEHQTELTTPNPWAGAYFLPNTPEGMYIPMSHNAFKYPHPAITIDQFFW